MTPTIIAATITMEVAAPSSCLQGIAHPEHDRQLEADHP
jgi:hypothetical protein